MENAFAIYSLNFFRGGVGYCDRVVEIWMEKIEKYVRIYRQHKCYNWHGGFLATRACLCCRGGNRQKHTP